MFVQLKAITSADEFIKSLFREPGSKAVTTYEGKHEIVDNPELFYQAVNLYLDYMVLPEKKFKNITNFDQEIKGLLKLLTPKDKFSRLLRPAMTNLYYNAARHEICGTDATIMWVYDSFHRLGEEDKLINTDKLGNIIITKESEYEGGKYPDYNAVLPTVNENDNKYHINDLMIDKIFYLVKLAKIVGLKYVYIKIGLSTFDGYSLARLIEAFKISLNNYNFILYVPKFNRAAYISVNENRYKGLIMPMVETSESLTYKLI